MSRYVALVGINFGESRVEPKDSFDPADVHLVASQVQELIDTGRIVPASGQGSLGKKALDVEVARRERLVEILDIRPQQGAAPIVSRVQGEIDSPITPQFEGQIGQPQAPPPDGVDEDPRVMPSEQTADEEAEEEQEGR